MENGKIIEEGNHNELIKKKGIYYNLYKKQEINISDEFLENKENMNNTDSKNDEVLTESISNISKTKIEYRNFQNEIFNENNVDKNIINKKESKNTNDSDIISYKYMDSNTYNPDKQFKNIRVFKKMNWKRYIELNKKYYILILIGIIGTLMVGTISPINSYIFSSALSAFNEHGENLLKKGNFWSLMFILLGFLNFSSMALQSIGLGVSKDLLSYKLRSKMFKSILYQDMTFFDENDKSNNNNDLSSNKFDYNNNSQQTNSGFLTSTLSLEVDLMNSFNNEIASILKEIITFTVGLIIALINNCKLSIYMLTSLPFIILCVYMQMKSIRNKNEIIRSTFNNSSTVVSESLINIRTVYELNLQNVFKTKYSNYLNNPQKKLERKYLITSFWSSLILFLKYSTLTIGYFYGAKFIENENVDFYKVYTSIQAMEIVIGSILSFSSIAPNYDKSVEAFNHILRILDRESKINAYRESDSSNTNFKKFFTNKKLNNIIDNDFKPNILIENIKFNYPSRPNTNAVFLKEPYSKFEIPYGKKYGIIGKSGCGKSTLISLILRLYDINTGEININNINIKQYNLKWLRKQMAIVTQESYLFNISIKDNILNGKLNVTQSEVEEAARKANIHDFIVSLPDGYNTIVGDEGSSQLSGGQKQRISIARAIIRNPKILILDEATSALDAESELLIQKSLDELSCGRTTITIAHRLSTIKDYDCIIVMSDGNIIEIGNPDELYRKKGEYYNMVNIINKI